MSVKCDVCFRGCLLEEGQVGFCRARRNVGGAVICDNYGEITSLALDPIEKKPLMRFMPGSMILSAGSYGCNLACMFCQNYSISTTKKEENLLTEISPAEMVEKALRLREQGNIGIAYTYNEPLIGYEYVRDTAKAARAEGLKNVVVTNGCFSERVFGEIIGVVDAMNIDLKGFTKEYYQKLGGDFETVKNFIKMSHESGCHIELTTLLVPGYNDSEGETEAMAAWIASMSSDIPYHISRFFGRWKMEDAGSTPVSSVFKAVEIAKRHLKFVYAGNV